MADAPLLQSTTAASADASAADVASGQEKDENGWTVEEKLKLVLEDGERRLLKKQGMGGGDVDDDESSAAPADSEYLEPRYACGHIWKTMPIDGEERQALDSRSQYMQSSDNGDGSSDADSDDDDDDDDDYDDDDDDDRRNAKKKNRALERGLTLVKYMLAAAMAKFHAERLITTPVMFMMRRLNLFQESPCELGMRLALLGIPAGDRPGFPPSSWPAVKSSDDELAAAAKNMRASAILIVGCSPLGGIYSQLEPNAAQAVVKCALQLGIRDFDTAPHYGLGMSETRLGEALTALGPASKSGGSDSDFLGNENGTDASDDDDDVLAQDVRVYTKVGRVVLRGDEARAELREESSSIEEDNLPGTKTTVFVDSPRDAVPILDYSSGGVSRSFADSLARLGFPAVNDGSNRVVGLRVHDADTADRMAQVCANEGGAASGLRELRDSGSIDDVSIGMNDAKLILEMIEKCPTGTFDSVMMAGCWNLLDTSLVALKVLHTCDTLDIKVHLAGVFASGLLAGKDTYKYAKAPQDKIAKTREWSQLCDKFGLPLPAVALNFALLPSVVKKVAVGVRSPEELEQCVEWIQKYKVPLKLWEEAVRMKLLPKWIPIPLRST